MVKKFLLCFFFLLIALCSSVFAAPRLVTIHETAVTNIYSQDTTLSGTDYVIVGNGVSYDTAKFFCVTLEVVDDDGEMPSIPEYNPPSISFDLSGGRYSFWDSYTTKKVNGEAKTFTTASARTVTDPVNNTAGALRWGINEYAYVPTNTEGDWVHFLDEAETGLSGVNVTWHYPDSTETGSAAVPAFDTTAKQLTQFVPYIKYNMSGTMSNGDIKLDSIEWKLVKSSDVSTPINDKDVHFEIASIFNINSDMDKTDEVFKFDITSGSNAEGSKTLDTPLQGVPWCTIVRYYIGNDKNTIYQWRFISKNVTETSFTNYEGGSAVFEAGLTDGKSDYTYARYDGSNIAELAMWPVPVLIDGKFLTEGTFTIKNGGTFTILDSDGEKVADYDTADDITLPLHTRTPLGSSYVEYSYMTEGYRKAYWKYYSDAYSTRGTKFMDDTGSLNGKDVTWSIAGFNGTGKISAVKTLEQQFDKSTGGFFPYVELVSSDGYITAVNYRLVQSPDISTTYNPDNAVYIDMGVQTENGATPSMTNFIAGEDWVSQFSTSGTMTLETPMQQGEYTAVRLLIHVFKIPDDSETGLNMNDPENYETYRWNFIDQPPAADTFRMMEEDMETASKDKIVDSLLELTDEEELTSEDINYIEDRENIFEESETTADALAYFKDRDIKMKGRFKKLYGQTPGWFVTKIKLPQELLDLLNGLSPEELKVYALTDSELSASGSSVSLADGDTPKTGILVNLDGSKVDKIDGSETEFLMASYLDPDNGGVSNMYLGIASDAENSSPENNNPENNSDGNTIKSSSGGGCNLIMSEELGIRSALLLLAFFALAFMKFKRV